MTITLSFQYNIISLKLNDEKTKISLNGRPLALIMKTENGKLNIYGYIWHGNTWRAGQTKCIQHLIAGDRSYFFMEMHQLGSKCSSYIKQTPDNIGSMVTTNPRHYKTNEEKWALFILTIRYQKSVFQCYSGKEAISTWFCIHPVELKSILLLLQMIQTSTIQVKRCLSHMKSVSLNQVIGRWKSPQLTLQVPEKLGYNIHGNESFCRCWNNRFECPK